MRRLPLFLIVITLAVLILAACSPGSTPINPSGTPTATPVTPPVPTIVPSATADLRAEAAHVRGLSLRIWHAFTGPSAAALENQVAMFNTVNEWGITVYLERQPDYRSLYEALQSHPEQPDLIATLPEQILALAEAGQLVELTPYVTHGRWGIPQETIEDIPAAFWQQEEINGKRWAVPLARSAHFLIYNSTWGRELGFAHPPKTAEQFRQQACAANAALRADADVRNDGYGGWMVDTHWQTAYTWLLAFEGTVWENGIYHFDTTANRAALTFLKELYDEHCAWLPLDVAPAEGFARRLALIVSGDLSDLTEFEAALTRAQSKDEWTLIPYPGPRHTAVSTYGVSLAILRTAPARQLAAWLFLRWLFSPENQARWATESGFLPLRVAALNLLEEYRAAHPQWEAALEYTPSLQTTPPTASWRTLRYVLADGMTHIFRLNLPPEQIPTVLQEMQATSQELVSDN